MRIEMNQTTLRDKDDVELTARGPLGSTLDTDAVSDAFYVPVSGKGKLGVGVKKFVAKKPAEITLAISSQLLEEALALRRLHLESLLDKDQVCDYISQNFCLLMLKLQSPP
jgi:hypothetical protein